MFNSYLVPSILTIALLSACSLGEAPPAPANQLTRQEIKAAWEKSMSKSADHALLEEMSGTWNASVKFWAQARSEPAVSTAKSIYKSILNGKFLIEDYQGTYSEKSYQGMSIMGYDTILQKFNNYWVDNMGTGAIYSEGTYNSETKTISLNGEVTDPITKTKRPTLSTLKIIDKDNHLLEMYDLLPGGKKFKTLEIEYKRISQ